MAKNTVLLKYDELTSIARQLKDEGEDMVRLHSHTRQRVRDLYKEWEGEAAKKFFDEMETRLLPAVQRLAQALFHTQDVTDEIMKIIRDADEETAGFFRNQLSGDDFGASRFGEALQGVKGTSPGSDDFGAGRFSDALVNPPTVGGSSTPDDFGAGKFGEALGGDSPSTSNDHGQSGESTSSEGGGGVGDSSEKKSKEAEASEVETESTAGGGGGGSSSQGLQGDLKQMGVGLGDVTPQNASSGGGTSGPAVTPDHVYSGGGSSEAGSNDLIPGSDSGSGAGQPSPEGGSGAAAGAAGAAGAAVAGGAAKAVKGKAKKNAD